jgi:hypothetical protein
MEKRPDDFDANYFGERYRPLVIIGWDSFMQKPCVSMETQDWDDLDWRQEQLVFQAIATLAIDFAPLAIPDEYIEGLIDGEEQG